MNYVAELLGSFQVSSDFGRADEDDMAVKTAATFKRCHAVAMQPIGSLESSDAFPDVCN
jgi:hypothetical protein